MAYKALYRTFRPLKFIDVVGQEHITTTIKNQIQSGRIAHAYLFSGGRGSGKTSTAKILARAVNCLNPQNGEPCNECEICKAALDGSLTDISEIDAASNNGVDNIREIREEVEFVPTSAKYRVYIIDEVHMLSTGAFNALLKTLEEPPKHVIFILATTEPQKLPVTILSRCQRYDFRKISSDNIVKRLQYICQEIHVEPEENALRFIAKMSGGALRDAISLLDRCITDGDTKITEEKIKDLVGMPEFEYLSQMIEVIGKKDVNRLFSLCEKIIDAGMDLEYYIQELMKFVRDIAVFRMTNEAEGYHEEEKMVMKNLMTLYHSHSLLELITVFSELQSNMKWASDKEIIFEVGLIKAIKLQEEAENHFQNVATTENLNKQTRHSMPEQHVTAQIIPESNMTPEEKSSEMPYNRDLKEKVLTNLKENRKMIMHTILSNATFQQAEDDLIHILFEKNTDDVNKQYMQKEESKVLIKEVVKNVMRKEMRIKYVF